MIENRFILAEDSNGLFSIFDNEDPEDEPLIYGAKFGTEKIVDLLNEFNDENKELKAEIEQSDSISEDIVCADIQHQLLKVIDENKELKKENKKLIEEWEFSFRTELAHHRFAEKELQEKIREKQATIQSLKEENKKLKNIHWY